MKELVKKVVYQLLTPNNTVTTLEVKQECISQFPEYYWKQEFIKNVVDELLTEGDLFVSDDNGTFRTYSSNKLKPVDKPSKIKSPKIVTNNKAKIGRKKVLDILESSKGKFITVSFIKKDDSNRIMNCKYMGHNNLGYAEVIETKSKTIKNVNLQTIYSIKSSGVVYNVNK